MCLPSLGTSEPTVRTPDWSRPMGFYSSLQGLPYPYVCYVCLCVSHFSPRRGSRRPGFADVGPKVLIRYYYHSYGAQFLCWRLSLGENGNAPDRERRPAELISPEAALYGHWMEWRESNRSGRPLFMGDTLRLTGAVCHVPPQ